MSLAHPLVLKFAWADDGATARLRLALARAGIAAAGVRTYRALDEPLAYAYLDAVDDAHAASLRSSLAAAFGGSARALRLRPLLVLPGAAAGPRAPWHYVVETDVLPEADADFNAWYDTEHLPGLAAVPGTVRAARYLNLDDGPRYHACYDLASRETFGSPQWLAVRATDWSSRVRPAFRNTRRTMFERIESP